MSKFVSISVSMFVSIFVSIIAPFCSMVTMDCRILRECMNQIIK